MSNPPSSSPSISSTSILISTFPHHRPTQIPTTSSEHNFQLPPQPNPTNHTPTSQPPKQPTMSDNKSTSSGSGSTIDIGRGNGGGASSSSSSDGGSSSSGSTIDIGHGNGGGGSSSSGTSGFGSGSGSGNAHYYETIETTTEVIETYTETEWSGSGGSSKSKR